jgi:hypothetical protein
VPRSFGRYDVDLPVLALNLGGGLSQALQIRGLSRGRIVDDGCSYQPLQYISQPVLYLANDDGPGP